MAIILHIETATSVCAISLADNGKLILEKVADEEREHARLLTVMIDELLSSAGYSYKQLDAIAVSKGPGSYTGLRIGVATAKGLCFALDKPLIAVNTLFSMAWCMKEQMGEEYILNENLFCPMIDARRQEVYTAVYNQALIELQPACALVLNPGSFTEWKDKKLIFFGDGAMKFEALVAKELDVIFPSWFRFNSRGLVDAAARRFNDGLFEDTAYFEPFYLKDFIAGPSKNT